MSTIKCLYCSKPTTRHNINVQKKIDGKIITVSNSPVFYCKDCDETFLAKDTMDVFEFLKVRGLTRTKILFDFPDIHKKLLKAEE